MNSRLLFAAFLASLSIVPLASRARVQADARGPQSLTALVGPRSLARDTNGDGLPDVVAARVIVPADPTLADVDSPDTLAEYQAGKRARKAAMRAEMSAQ